MAVSVLDIDREREEVLTWNGEEGINIAVSDCPQSRASHALWAIREASREGRDLIITQEACARLALDTPDPYDEYGDSIFGVLDEMGDVDG